MRVSIGDPRARGHYPSEWSHPLNILHGHLLPVQLYIIQVPHPYCFHLVEI